MGSCAELQVVSRPLVFLPQVHRDFSTGREYYESLSPGRGGERFEAAFRRVLTQIQVGIVTHGRVFEHFHRVYLRKYPYCLYYRLVEDKAVITALLYARFAPARIRNALKEITV